MLIPSDKIRAKARRYHRIALLWVRRGDPETASRYLGYATGLLLAFEGSPPPHDFKRHQLVWRIVRDAQANAADVKRAA